VADLLQPKQVAI